ncbi:MAG TPA: Crp/Fnr family transcriptional regulator [Thiotrichales bacterium]|nr:Crp/Fnr family transcriptional regulator [Thiotrichales bacterium]
MNNLPLWEHHFPDLLASADPPLRRLMEAAQAVTLPAGERVFEPGAACRHYLLVTAGAVRVQYLTLSGREVLLYHVRPGESCVLTTACVLGGERYPAEGITDEETSALVIPLPLFAETLDRSAPFRRFVFANLAQRLAGVMARMEEVAFGPVESRLARTLLELATTRGSTLAVTHGELASELGTAREVVSRHLKRFEGEGLLRLSRGEIRLLDPSALQRVAGTPAD